jgi:hypothetical protein
MPPSVTPSPSPLSPSPTEIVVEIPTLITAVASLLLLFFSLIFLGKGCLRLHRRSRLRKVVNENAALITGRIRSTGNFVDSLFPSVRSRAHLVRRKVYVYQEYQLNATELHQSTSEFDEKTRDEGGVYVVRRWSDVNEKGLGWEAALGMFNLTQRASMDETSPNLAGLTMQTEDDKHLLVPSSTVSEIPAEDCKAMSLPPPPAGFYSILSGYTSVPSIEAPTVGAIRVTWSVSALPNTVLSVLGRVVKLDAGGSKEAGVGGGRGVSRGAFDDTVDAPECAEYAEYADEMSPLFPSVAKKQSRACCLPRESEALGQGVCETYTPTTPEAIHLAMSQTLAAKRPRNYEAVAHAQLPYPFANHAPILLLSNAKRSKKQIISAILPAKPTTLHYLSPLLILLAILSLGSLTESISFNIHHAILHGVKIVYKAGVMYLEVTIVLGVLLVVAFGVGSVCIMC